MLRASFFVCLALAGACGSTVASGVMVRHPLHTGSVDPNVVEIGRLPRRDRAALVELTPDRICIEVELFGRGPEDARAVIENYDVGLVADDDSVEQRDPTVMRGSPHYASAGGGLFVQERQGRGSFLYFPSSLCFPNQGFVDMQTRRLRLELRDRGARRSRAFSWDLVPGTASQEPAAPGQIEGRPPSVFVSAAVAAAP